LRTFRMAIRHTLANATLFIYNLDPDVFFTTRNSYIRFFNEKIPCARLAGMEGMDKIG